MFCHNCGTKLEEGEQFCYNCGTAVRHREEAENGSFTQPEPAPGSFEEAPVPAYQKVADPFSPVSVKQADPTLQKADFTPDQSFDIERFWQENMQSLLLPNIKPDPWLVGSAGSIPPKTLKNAFKIIGKKMIPMPEIIGMAGLKVGNAGFLLGRNGIGFQTLLPQDGTTAAFLLGGLLGASIYNASKSKGGDYAFLYYRDIANVSYDEKFVYVTLKKGASVKLYMSEFFNPEGVANALDVLKEHF